MMFSEIGLKTGKGAATAEPSAPAAKGAATKGDAFSSLVDRATGAQGNDAPAAGAKASGAKANDGKTAGAKTGDVPAGDGKTGDAKSSDAPAGKTGAKGVIHRVFVAEWCLSGVDGDAAVTQRVGVPVDGVDSEEESETAIGEDGQDDEGDAPEGAIVVAPLQQPVPVPQPMSGVRPEAAAAGVSEQAARGAVEPAAPVVTAATIDVAEPVDGADQTPAAEVKTPAGKQGAADPPQLKQMAQAAAHAVKAAATNQKPTAEGTPQAAAEVPVEVAPADGRASQTEAMAEKPAEPAGRGRAVAAQLSRAIERTGAVTVEAAAAQAGDQSGSSTGGHTPGFGGDAPRDFTRTPTAASPASMHAFAAHIGAELTRVAEATATVGAAETAFAGSAPTPETADQIVQSMRMQFRDGIGSATLRLRPEHLGEVSISLRVEQQSVSATIHAEVPAVRQWLETQESTLRNGLSNQGLTLDELVVREDDTNQSQQREQDAEPGSRRQSRQQRRTEDEQKFEVLV